MCDRHPRGRHGATSVLTVDVAASSPIPAVANNLLFSALGIGDLAGGMVAVALPARHLEQIYVIALAAWGATVGVFSAVPCIELARDDPPWRHQHSRRNR